MDIDAPKEPALCAYDGKSIRSTLTDSLGNKQNFASIVSWFSQESRLVLALEKLENKETSEIHCVREMVKNTALSNQVLTLDAVHCQKETIQTINCSNNDDVVAVKKNPAKLYNYLEKISQDQIPFQENVRTEKSHGRQVTREISVFEVPETVAKIWQGSQRLRLLSRKAPARDRWSVFYQSRKER